MDPPWIHAPGLHYGHGQWRQGPLESYKRRWFSWVEGLPREEALNYLRNSNPPEEGYWAFEIGRYLQKLECADWQVLQ